VRLVRESELKLTERENDADARDRAADARDWKMWSVAPMGGLSAASNVMIRAVDAAETSRRFRCRRSTLNDPKLPNSRLEADQQG
jgi:hypothetical protein